MEGSPSDLAAKLDEELDEFVSKLKPKKYEDGWPEDKWEEEMAKHPFFMDKPLNEGDEVPPLVEALQQLKYDADVNTPEELARAHKDDGNEYFKLKKYRWAVEAFSEGLKQKCDDKTLNAQLLVNRAASHFHIGNYKKSLKDAVEAKTLQPDYMKAIHRGALCHFKLQEYDDCISWCQDGLKFEPSSVELTDLKIKAEKEKKILERDKRKAIVKAEKKKKEMTQLQEALEMRGIRFDGPQDLIPVDTGLVDSMVHIDENGCLVWPVMFLYPEHSVTDYIQYFHEDSCFADHFKDMFAEENRPSWDQEGKYHPAMFKVSFKCVENDYLIPVDLHQSLKFIISDSRFKLCAGTPTFFVTVKDSKFDDYWSKKNSKSLRINK